MNWAITDSINKYIEEVYILLCNNFIFIFQELHFIEKMFLNHIYFMFLKILFRKGVL